MNTATGCRSNGGAATWELVMSESVHAWSLFYMGRVQELADAAKRADARIGAVFLRREDVRTHHFVQRVEHLGDAQIADVGDGARGEIGKVGEGPVAAGNDDVLGYRLPHALHGADGVVDLAVAGIRDELVQVTDHATVLIRHGHSPVGVITPSTRSSG